MPLSNPTAGVPASELPDLTPLQLSNLQALVVDSDAARAQQTMAALKTAGLVHLHHAENGEAALAVIRSGMVDVLYAEWELEQDSGVEFTLFIRRLTAPDERMLPVILLGMPDTPDARRAAENAGANAWLVKPCAPKALLAPLIPLVHAPTPFIVAPGYIGPDRRDDTIELMKGWERREEDENTLIPVAREMMSEPFPDTRPRIVMPDFELRERLDSVYITGRVPPRQRLPVKEAEKEEPTQPTPQIQDPPASLLAEMSELHAALKSLTQTSSDGVACLMRMENASLAIRTQGVPAGYALAANVAALLYEFVKWECSTENAHHRTVLAKCIETLGVIFHTRLKGEGGPLGAQLLRELRQLIGKYR